MKILGCGSAYIAGCVGAHLIEQLARIPAHAEPASEFRYRNPVIEPDTLYIAVSQSGETFDTLAAVQEVKRKGGRVFGIVNVGRQHHRARMRPRHLSARRARNRRRLDQDLHLHRRRVRAVRDSSRAPARPVHRERRAAAQRAEALPAQVEAILAQEDRTSPPSRAPSRSARTPTSSAAPPAIPSRWKAL